MLNCQILLINYSEKSVIIHITPNNIKFLTRPICCSNDLLEEEKGTINEEIKKKLVNLFEKFQGKSDIILNISRCTRNCSIVKLFPGENTESVLSYLVDKANVLACEVKEGDDVIRLVETVLDKANNLKKVKAVTEVLLTIEEIKKNLIIEIFKGDKERLVKGKEKHGDCILKLNLDEIFL